MVAVLALAIPFGAITAKVYSEVIDEAAHDVHDGLLDAGSGRLAALLYGILPAVAPDLVSYAFYRFECSVRSAVIFGMIGVGGLGFQLSLSFQALEYHQMWTLIYATIVISAGVDRWGAALRRRPSRRRTRASLGLGAVLAVTAAVHLGPDFTRLFAARTWRLLGDLARESWPPAIPERGGAPCCDRLSRPCKCHCWPSLWAAVSRWAPPFSLSALSRGRGVPPSACSRACSCLSRGLFRPRCGPCSCCS